MVGARSSALAAVPVVLVAPFAGLIDRRSRRTVMLAADTFAAVGPALALVLALTGRLEVWHLAVAGFLASLGNAVQSPPQAAVPLLVTPAALGRANGLNQLGPAVGFVLGPALATPLVAAWGVQSVLVVDAVTFVVAVSTTALVRFGEIPVSQLTRPTVVMDGVPRGNGCARPAARCSRCSWRWRSSTAASASTTSPSRCWRSMSPARRARGWCSRPPAQRWSAVLCGSDGVVCRAIACGALVHGLAVMGVGAVVSAARPSVAWVVAGVFVALAAAVRRQRVDGDDLPRARAATDAGACVRVAVRHRTRPRSDRRRVGWGLDRDGRGTRGGGRIVGRGGGDGRARSVAAAVVGVRRARHRDRGTATRPRRCRRRGYDRVN